MWEINLCLFLSAFPLSSSFSFTHSLHIFKSRVGWQHKTCSLPPRGSLRWRDINRVLLYNMENPCQRHGIEAGAIWRAPLVPFLCFLSSFSFLLLRSNVTGPGVRLDTGPMGLRGLSSGWIDCQPTFCHMGLWESLRAKLASAHLKQKALYGISPMAVAKEEEENREQLKSRDHLTLVSLT